MKKYLFLLSIFAFSTTSFSLEVEGPTETSSTSDNSKTIHLKAENISIDPGQTYDLLHIFLDQDPEEVKTILSNKGDYPTPYDIEDWQAKNSRLKNFKSMLVKDQSGQAIAIAHIDAENKIVIFPANAYKKENILIKDTENGIKFLIQQTKE